MTTYDKEYKQGIITRLLPPNSESIPKVALDTNIPKGTLYGWKAAYLKKQGETVQDEPSTLSSEEKFAVVLKCATLNESEISSYCREQGLFPEQLARWRMQCQLANKSSTCAEQPEARQKRVELEKDNRRLTSELHRKEKALAEAAALLVLQKKFQALWVDEAL